MAFSWPHSHRLNRVYRVVLEKVPRLSSTHTQEDPVNLMVHPTYEGDVRSSPIRKNDFYSESQRTKVKPFTITHFQDDIFGTMLL